MQGRQQIFGRIPQRCPDVCHGEVDTEVLRDDGTLHGREDELALAREALTIEAEHGDIIG